MTPLVFAIIGAFGILYLVGWLVNIGIWNRQQHIPGKSTLWLPLFIGLVFIAVDIYGFTVFPNGTPAIGLVLGAILMHFFLFLGAIVKAARLSKHRCPQCDRWLEIEKEVSETDIEEAYTLITTKRCIFCDYEDMKTKTCTEGVGHAVMLPNPYVNFGKEKKDEQDKDIERIKADEIEI